MAFNYIIVQTQHENNKYRIIQREYLYPKKWFLVSDCLTGDKRRVRYGNFVDKNVLQISKNILKGHTEDEFISSKIIGNAIVIEDF